MQAVACVHTRQLPVGHNAAVVSVCVPTREHDELTVRRGDLHDPTVGQRAGEVDELPDFVRLDDARCARDWLSPVVDHAFDLILGSARAHPYSPADR